MSALTEAPPAMATKYPYFTEEHDMFRETVKQFVQAEIAPYAEEWDEEGIFPREIFKKSADLGLFGIRLNPKYGGSGLDWWYTAAYLEGFSYANSGGVSMAMFVQSDITLPVLDELGTDEQKEEFMRPAIAGDRVAALGISEPGGGSDVAALTTRARSDGDDLVISGPHRNAHPRHIGSAVARPNLLGPHTGAGEGLPVPSIKAKDAVGFGHDMPTLEIVQNHPLGLSDLDMPPVRPALELT